MLWQPNYFSFGRVKYKLEMKIMWKMEINQKRQDLNLGRQEHNQVMCQGDAHKAIGSDSLTTF